MAHELLLVIFFYRIRNTVKYDRVKIFNDTVYIRLKITLCLISIFDGRTYKLDPWTNRHAGRNSDLDFKRF